MALEQHKQKALIKAFVKKIPGINYFRNLKTRGSNESKYCYSVWLRHLVLLSKYSHNAPKVIAELGPGDSIGVCLAALLSGTEKIYAFDVNNTINIEENLKIFDELIELFKNLTPIPGNDIYPRLNPHLDSYDFPKNLITREILKYTMDNERIQIIRSEIMKLKEATNFNGTFICYQAPWNTTEAFFTSSIDLVLSQAVLEHVLNLDETYEIMKKWLCNGGYLSHQIDFKCHGTSTKWNGHWLYGPVEWQYVNDVEGPAINRKTYKYHLNMLEQKGFNILLTNLVKRSDGFPYNYLLEKFPSTDISKEEFETSGMFVIAKK